jgi:N-acetylmuramic acid 6-phosphate etherase
MVETITSRGHLMTEQNNPRSQELDRLTSLEIVELFNSEDERNIAAIALAKAGIAATIDAAAERLQRGGRLFYIGAGTSGRLGVLDAVECPPTFCSPPELVRGILAGGLPALVKSSEGLEDIFADGAQAMADVNLSEADVVVGITAGGTTPYVAGAIAAANQLGAATVTIACVPEEQVPTEAKIQIRLLVGPELLAGSTRLKAGTVTKMALNIISTGTMVKLGKVYGNRMVDVAVTNSKLHDRAIRIVADLTSLDRPAAAELLEAGDRQVKLALLMHWTGSTKEAGKALLAEHKGQLRDALEAAKK